MKTIIFPVVWAFTLTLALPSHRPSSAQRHVCCEERLSPTNNCPGSADDLTASQRAALDKVDAQMDATGYGSSPHSGGAAPDLVID